MCYSPITIKTPQGYRKVPCGRCLECLVKYQNDWSARMYEELKAHDGKGVFFTLTYDDNHVPKNYLKYGVDVGGNIVYELYRSPSDYGYDNTYTDEKGREKVLPSCGRERKHRSVAPYVELQSLGYDVEHILDFNIKRANHKQFIDQIVKIYGNFVRNVEDCIVCPEPVDSGDCCGSERVCSYDFDDYDGCDFDEAVEETRELQREFAEVLEDDDYDEVPVNPILASRVDERPIMQFNSVRKEDVQNWLKRGRDKLKRKGLEFTYFITSEYGPRTLRPHYHGVLFGVTATEALCMAKDWQKHFGVRISWSDVDLSKGDMSYCAKYCSKSFFEHPLCSRDFFYSRKLQASDGTDVLPFSEYHSKHYERCIEIFGIDAPIVDKSFKLISKGLGEAWVECNKKMVQDFDDLSLLEYERNQFDHDDSSYTLCIAPFDTNYDSFVRIVENNPELGFIDDDGFISVSASTHFEKIENNDKKMKDYGECIERLFDSFKYYRTYKDKTYAFGVPKYYRTKMLRGAVQSAFANYVQSVNVELYKEKLEELHSCRPSWEDAEIVSYLEAQDRESHYQRARNIYDNLKRKYNKSQI